MMSCPCPPTCGFEIYYHQAFVLTYTGKKKSKIQIKVCTCTNVKKSENNTWHRKYMSHMENFLYLRCTPFFLKTTFEFFVCISRRYDVKKYLCCCFKWLFGCCEMQNNVKFQSIYTNTKFIMSKFYLPHGWRHWIFSLTVKHTTEKWNKGAWNNWNQTNK